MSGVFSKVFIGEENLDTMGDVPGLIGWEVLTWVSLSMNVVMLLDWFMSRGMYNPFGYAFLFKTENCVNAVADRLRTFKDNLKGAELTKFNSLITLSSAVTK